MPQYWLPRYDWVLSMEVLEHIPAAYENVVLDNIVRAAGHGAVLSWAPPGQPGLGHINNKPLTYVKQAMTSRGFTMDDKTSATIRQQATYYWLRKNIAVFVRSKSD